MAFYTAVPFKAFRLFASTEEIGAAIKAAAASTTTTAERATEADGSEENVTDMATEVGAEAEEVRIDLFAC